ncbi:hypothetical protein PQE75_gp139 [Bacillus phage vB_BcoS-136]|uniref:Uncharacterized protein n=1 Tax=Bacillus phage vB_BcoS-136 TaxID=2419619 RepID=A0A3G3BW14_9CAUD|nr:hypothetical protein PQE75_gp139 [Bacillus phage vB_BcoS-136]AYP68340.1 hypothetical protein vBBcoS136_00226 [Bacillus phage vB_BcoS-136]
MRCEICRKSKVILFGYGGKELCLPCKRKKEKENDRQKFPFYKRSGYMKRKRYRYILCGVVSGTDKIKYFRLIGASNMKSDYKHVAIRVNIPNDLELEKWSCDTYSTTDDERTLDELGYDVLIWYEKDKKWKIHNELKGTNPCDVPFRLGRD